jgi:hypothetical protein
MKSKKKLSPGGKRSRGGDDDRDGGGVEQQDSWAKYDDSDSEGENDEVVRSPLADPSTLSNQKAIAKALHKKPTSSRSTIDGPSLMQIGKCLYRGSKIGRMREETQGLNMEKRAGNRPLTAKAGPHLFATSTASPSSSVENLMRRII